MGIDIHILPADRFVHHRSRSFKDELVAMLRKAGIDYDPQYLD
ncbi:MAG: hypothetical protein ACKVT0_03630 [Planctomycetaceae bacterium]